MIDSFVLDRDALNRIDSDEIVTILGIDLATVTPDESHVAVWQDCITGTWELPTHGLIVGDRVVLWTLTDEAGVNDVSVVEADGDDISEQVREYAEDIASQLGNLCDVSSGEHYSTQGVQYQHQAVGDFDRDGYRVIVTPRE